MCKTYSSQPGPAAATVVPATKGNLVRNWACALIFCPHGTPALAAQSPDRQTVGPWGQEWDAIADKASGLQDQLYQGDPFLPAPPSPSHPLS